MTLSARERQVLSLVARGYSNQEIADALVISYHTVEKHRDNIHKRLGVRTGAQAVYEAIRRGELEVA